MALLGAAPALAQAGAQTGVPGAVSLSGGATLTSDDRLRGLTESGYAPALQGTATLATRAGPYVGVWASTIHGYVAEGADAEIDLFAGYRRALGGGTLDVGLTRYLYPGTGGVDRGWFEPYASISGTLGPVSAKLGGDVAWRQRALALGDGGARGGLYGYAELSAGIPATPLTLTGHLGRSFERSYATFGERYTDWSLAAAWVRGPLTLALAYVDTDRADRLVTVPGRRRDVGGAGVTGSIGLSF